MNSKQKKEREKEKRDILMTLPGFINQLLLLLNSGMVLTEAFSQIAVNYGRLHDSRKNYFTQKINSIYLQAEETGENPVKAFYEFGRQSNVKELSRAATILLENQNKGTDLWDKLAQQGENLWKERKQMAMENIRLAESKMSFPMGIFLLSLIIMTAAPAMMQMQ